MARRVALTSLRDFLGCHASGVPTAAAPAAGVPAANKATPDLQVNLDAWGNAGIVGSIDRAGQNSLYHFTATRGGILFVTPVVTTANRWDVHVSLLSESGQVLASNDDESTANPIGLGGVNIQAGAMYRLVVDGHGSATGGYRVDLRTALSRTDDIPNDFAHAAPLLLTSYGQGSRQGVIEIAGDADMYAFIAPMTGRMWIREQLQAQSAVDPYLYAYDASQNLLAANNDAEGGRTSLVVVDVVAGSRYYLKAAANGNSTGGYRLALVTTTYNDDFGNTFSTAKQLNAVDTGAASMSGNIEVRLRRRHVPLYDDQERPDHDQALGHVGQCAGHVPLRVHLQRHADRREQQRAARRRQPTGRQRHGGRHLLRQSGQLEQHQRGVLPPDRHARLRSARRFRQHLLHGEVAHPVRAGHGLNAGQHRGEHGRGYVLLHDQVHGAGDDPAIGDVGQFARQSPVRVRCRRQSRGAEQQRPSRHGQPTDDEHLLRGDLLREGGEHQRHQRRQYLVQIQNIAAAPPTGNFNVTLIVSGLTAEQQRVARDAAARWERAIVGDLPDVWVNGQRIDDVAIRLGGKNIDGTGGILGWSASDERRRAEREPVAVLRLHRNGLGRHGLPAKRGPAAGRLDPRNRPRAGLRHHLAAEGAAQRRRHPRPAVRGARGPPPSTATCSATAKRACPWRTSWRPRARALSHWRESVFATELMTGWNDFGPNALSRVTVASMADLGYTVNMAAAESFRRPGTSAAAVALAGKQGAASGWTSYAGPASTAGAALPPYRLVGVDAWHIAALDVAPPRRRRPAVCGPMPPSTDLHSIAARDVVLRAWQSARAS